MGPFFLFIYIRSTYVHSPSQKSIFGQPTNRQGRIAEASSASAAAVSTGQPFAMLSGLKEKLTADFKLRMIELRNKELQLIVSQANGASIIFSLLTGIMSDSMLSGYYMYDIRAVGGTIVKGDKYIDNKSVWDELLELVVCFSMYTSIFLPILGIWVCMMISMLGPRCALGGPPDTFGETVDDLMDEFKVVPKILVLCIFSVFGTLATWSWAAFNEKSLETADNSTELVAGVVEGETTRTDAVIVTALAVFGGFLVYIVALFTHYRFAIKAGHVVTGRFGERERAGSPDMTLSPSEGAESDEGRSRTPSPFLGRHPMSYELLATEEEMARRHFDERRLREVTSPVASPTTAALLSLPALGPNPRPQTVFASSGLPLSPCSLTGRPFEPSWCQRASVTSKA